MTTINRMIERHAEFVESASEVYTGKGMVKISTMVSVLKYLLTTMGEILILLRDHGIDTTKPIMPGKTGLISERAKARKRK